jgi:hypothetical protein
MSNWDELFPEGRKVYCEGDAPDEFADEMLSHYGIDVTMAMCLAGEVTNWPEHRSFFIPSGLVEEIYGSERWHLGS